MVCRFLRQISQRLWFKLVFVETRDVSESLNARLIFASGYDYSIIYIYIIYAVNTKRPPDPWGLNGPGQGKFSLPTKLNVEHT